MNTTAILLVQQVLIMFLLVSVGYICFKTGKITIEGSRNIGNILIYLSLPCAIINSFMVECTQERLVGLLLSSVTAAVLLFLSIAISRLIFAKDAVLCFASSFSNPAFFGIPLIAATLSESSVFYVTSAIVFINLLQWSYGVALLTTKPGSEKKKDTWRKYIPSWKRLFTAPVMIACIIGLIFFTSGVKMPNVVQKSIQQIANLNTPLAMFSIGIYLAQTNILKMLCNVKLYLLSAVRLLIIPLISLVLLLFIPEQYSDMKIALLIVSACPVGSNVAVYAQLYKRDYAYAVETVIISTFLSIISIPLIVQLAEYVL